MSPKPLFRCEICLTIHGSLGRAKSCEKKGRPALAFRNGQTFDQPYSDSKRTVKIVGHKVILSWGKHINKYQVNWGGRRTSLSEKTIKQYITQKFWVPV